MRDSKSYCAILLDNNNRKPVCRLWFNRSQYYLGLFDEQKNEPDPTRPNWLPDASGLLPNDWNAAERQRAAIS